MATNPEECSAKSISCRLGESGFSNGAHSCQQSLLLVTENGGCWQDSKGTGGYDIKAKRNIINKEGSVASLQGMNLLAALPSINVANWSCQENIVHQHKNFA